jgi:hypothetical protein
VCKAVQGSKSASRTAARSTSGRTGIPAIGGRRKVDII